MLDKHQLMVLDLLLRTSELKIILEFNDLYQLFYPIKNTLNFVGKNNYLHL